MNLDAAKAMLEDIVAIDEANWRTTRIVVKVLRSLLIEYIKLAEEKQNEAL